MRWVGAYDITLDYDLFLKLIQEEVAKEEARADGALGFDREVTNV